jgi:hypothetical protein
MLFAGKITPIYYKRQRHGERLEKSRNRNVLTTGKLRFVVKIKNVVCMEGDGRFWLLDGKHILLERIAVDSLVSHIGSVIIYRGG